MMADRLLAAFLHYFGRPRKIAPRCRAHAQPALGCRAAAELSLAFNRSARDRTLLFKWLLPLQGFTDQAMRMVEHYIDGARSIGDAPSFYSVLGREPADSLFTCNYCIEIGLHPRFRRGQALAKARSATSAVDPDGETTVSSHGSAPFRRDPKLAVCRIRGEVRFS
jgi:hypothetical protein